jgi:hypothetical protein
MTYTTYLIVWILLIAANLYMAKVNTDSFYKLVAQKKYAQANIARRLVVVNLTLALGTSVLAVWCSF